MIKGNGIYIQKPGKLKFEQSKVKNHQPCLFIPWYPCTNFEIKCTDFIQNRKEAKFWNDYIVDIAGLFCPESKHVLCFIFHQNQRYMFQSIFSLERQTSWTMSIIGYYSLLWSINEETCAIFNSNRYGEAVPYIKCFWHTRDSDCHIWPALPPPPKAHTHVLCYTTGPYSYYSPEYKKRQKTLISLIVM